MALARPAQGHRIGIAEFIECGDMASHIRPVDTAEWIPEGIHQSRACIHRNQSVAF